jgi:hypothetical protein
MSKHITSAAPPATRNAPRLLRRTIRRHIARNARLVPAGDASTGSTPNPLTAAISRFKAHEKFLVQCTPTGRIEKHLSVIQLIIRSTTTNAIPPYGASMVGLPGNNRCRSIGTGWSFRRPNLVYATLRDSAGVSLPGLGARPKARMQQEDHSGGKPSTVLDDKDGT